MLNKYQLDLSIDNTIMIKSPYKKTYKIHVCPIIIFNTKEALPNPKPLAIRSFQVIWILFLVSVFKPGMFWSNIVIHMYA